MKEKKHKIAVVSSIAVAAIVSSCFVGGIIFGATSNVLLWLFFGSLSTWMVPVSIMYVNRGNNETTQIYDISKQTIIKCNDGVSKKEKSDNKVFLVDYDNLGLNCERKNIPVKNNVKVRKKTRND